MARETDNTSTWFVSFSSRSTIINKFSLQIGLGAVETDNTSTWLASFSTTSTIINKLSLQIGLDAVKPTVKLCLPRGKVFVTVR